MNLKGAKYVMLVILLTAINSCSSINVTQILATDIALYCYNLITFWFVNREKKKEIISSTASLGPYQLKRNWLKCIVYFRSPRTSYIPRLSSLMSIFWYLNTFNIVKPAFDSQKRCQRKISDHIKCWYTICCTNSNLVLVTRKDVILGL